MNHEPRTKKPKRLLFIDRDGTITREPDDDQLDRFDKLQFVPGVLCALARIARELPYELVMVTNQDGLGTEAFPEETFRPVHDLVMRTLEGEGIVFSGDQLFAGSVGRTDFPYGSWDDLMTSMQSQIMTLPDDIRVLPGHGPETTIGRERRANPFIREWLEA
jgi:hypothetical protein